MREIQVGDRMIWHREASNWGHVHNYYVAVLKVGKRVTVESSGGHRAGAGTTGLVADRLGRNAILIELNPEYVSIADRRIHADAACSQKSQRIS